MFSLNDYETESKRLMVLNQRFAFLMNGLQYVKLRQAAVPNDLRFEIMEKKIYGVLEDLLSKETTTLGNAVNPVTTPAGATGPKLELI